MSRFIVHGTHISENLLHHKTTDVRRILEEKGFSEAENSNAKEETVHFHPPAGTPEDGRETHIEFGDDGFVTGEGVSHTGE